MKIVDFDVAEVEYNMNKNKDIDIYSISYNKLVEKLRRPQKYVLLEAFNEIYSLEIQDVTDTAFFLKLTDDAIKHYTRVEEKIVDENKKLKKENEALKKENEKLKLDNDIKYWKQECLQLSNHQQVIFHELAEAFKQGYKPSKEYQKMRNDEKKRIEECKQKMERLRI